MGKINTLKICVVLFFLIGLCIFFISTNITQVHGQTQPTATESFASPTSTQTPQELQVETSQEIYQQVLEVSKSAVNEVHQTANEVLTWVGVLFVALSLVGFGGAWLLSTFAKRASDKASEAQEKAIEASELIKTIAKKASDLEKRYGVAQKKTNELNQKQNILLHQLESAEKLLHDMQKEIAQIKSGGEKDRQVIKKPLTLVQIDEYGMQALSGSPSEKDSSILSLIEMTFRTDAVVRRKAIKTLGILEKFDDRVVKRLKSIIELDPAQGVRKEAEKTLRLIEAKKPMKTTTQKS